MAFSDDETVPGCEGGTDADTSLGPAVEKLIAGGVPPSWRLEEQTKEDETYLWKVFNDFGLANSSFADKQQPAVAEADFNPYMKQLQASIDVGHVDTRSGLGQKFDAMRKKNAELAAKYARVGGNRQAQQRFKLNWAKLELEKEKMEVSKTEVETSREYENLEGAYRPFGRIVHLQGNDQAAYAAAVQIVKTCLLDYEAGRSFRGKPFVKFCPRSQRLVFLDFEEKVGVGYSKEQSIKMQQNMSGASSSNDNADGGNDPPTPAPKQTGKRGRGADPEPVPDTAEKKRKKEASKALQDILKTKALALATTQTTSDLISSIAEDAEYNWANNKEELNKLRHPRDQLETFKNGSSFFKDLFMQSEFQAWGGARKRFPRSLNSRRH